MDKELIVNGEWRMENTVIMINWKRRKEGWRLFVNYI